MDKAVLFPKESRTETPQQNKDSWRSNFWLKVQWFLAIVLLGISVILTIVFGMLFFNICPGLMTPVKKTIAMTAHEPVVTTASRGRELPPGHESMNSAVAIPPAEETLSVVINVPSRTLDIFAGSRLRKSYSVAVGRPTTPTPIGEFSIGYKECDPSWYPPGKDFVVPSGPGNPLGYRWLGFAPSYGVHGTNVPSSIGSAASNGCVRMREQDVEEVFALLPSGTPLQISYEVVRVTVDQDGHASIGVYPDIYGRKQDQPGLAEAKEKLAAAGLSGLASDQFLQKVLTEQAGQQIPFANMCRIKVNGQNLNVYAVRMDGNQSLVPVWAVANCLHRNLSWDSRDHMVQCGGYKASAVLKGDVLYVSAAGISTLFGGTRQWCPQENCLEFMMPSLVESMQTGGK